MASGFWELLEASGRLFEDRWKLLEASGGLWDALGGF